MTFVLLVLLSFFVLHEIDQVLKGRPKWYEKSAKRKVYYKGSFETGTSKVELLRSPDWKFLNTLWIRNRVNAKSYPDIRISGSSPVLYHEYCVQDGNLVPKFSLVLLTLPFPVFTTHALLPIFPEESWALEWIQIRVEGQIWKKIDLKMDTCGRGNFWIRKEIVADSKVSRYVWRGHEWTLEWLAIQWAFAEWYSSIWPSSTKRLFVSGTSINAKCTNDTYVKARPKRMAAVIFGDIATNCFH